LVVLLESIVDGLGVSGDSCILDGLGLLSEGVDMLVGQVFELSECFLLGCLVEDEILQEFKVLL
jgi:hypothetical protein